MSLAVSTEKDPTVTVVESATLVRCTPLVSVCIVTYNQSSYIRDALDSVLAQETNFDYEVIVGDDCSTDGTREILERYQRRHPRRIRLHLHEEHYDAGIPAKKNMITNLEAARGKYVALLDGDDYWISRDKLQRQVALLEERPAVAFAFHDARVVREGDRPATSKLSGGVREASLIARVLGQEEMQQSQNVSLRELFPPEKHPVPAPSIMYRRALFDPVPSWFWQVLSADLALQLYLAKQGPGYYQHGLLAAWREHGANLTSRRDREAESTRLRDVDILVQICPAFQEAASAQRALLHGVFAGRRRQELYRCLRAEQYGQALIKLWNGGWHLTQHFFHRLRVFQERVMPRG